MVLLNPASVLVGVHHWLDADAVQCASGWFLLVTTKGRMTSWGQWCLVLLQVS